MTSVDQSKITARQFARSRRAEAKRSDLEAGHKVAAAVLAWMAEEMRDRTPVTVATYLPISTELDTAPLVDALINAGHLHALPSVIAQAEPLEFRAWMPGQPLVDGGYGTRAPVPDAQTVNPNIIFVPLLAFDDAGYRLGYGGGFYDRTIAKLRRAGDVVPVGLAFSAQRVDTVPRDAFDEPLDWVATEQGVRRCGDRARQG